MLGISPLPLMRKEYVGGNLANFINKLERKR
jgi:hypothetical protein